MFMKGITVFPAADAPAVRYAADFLEERGVAIARSAEEAATHWLLPVPTPAELLKKIPPEVAVIGGKLDGLPDTYPRLDLLKSEGYQAKNAALTADCALRLLGQQLPVAFSGCPVLVIGWGRIGKCLCQSLAALGVRVTVAARKETDRAMATALGYDAVTMERIFPHRFRAIFNTAPAPVLSRGGEECIKIDLASQQGMAGANVIWARGLPGKMLPESSGRLMAQEILELLQKEVVK